MTWIDLRRPAIACASCALVIACGGDANGPSKAKATQLVLVTAPSATAETMTPLVAQPVVQVADANGRPVSRAVTVTASIASGNASVTSGRSVTSDANGRAAFSELTLGALTGPVGPLVLQFGAQDLTPATANVELRCALPALAIGQTVSRALAQGDCLSTRGAWLDAFALETTRPVTAVELALDQTGLAHPFLGVKGPDEPRSFWGWTFNGLASVNFKALLPAGANQVEVSTIAAGESGTYTLRVTAAPEDLTCEYPDAWVSGSLSTAQHLDADDCLDFAGDGVEDYVLVGLVAGETLTASMTATAFQPRILLVDAANGGIAASATTAGAASFTFTNGATNIPYYLVLASEPAGGQGAYTLSLTLTHAISAGAAPATRLSLGRAQSIVRRRRNPMSRGGTAVPAWVGSVQ